mmetsp:Transcript_109901/g.154084  ORF Transcript_109901/g.154084 Transcript_109901/m.154084 type:complete len:203 (+) Transcript_109901:194-802(+)
MEVECVLRGVVAEGDLEPLFTRLDSFCNADTKVDLSYHERVYRGDGVTRGADSGRGSRGTVMLRVRDHEAHPGKPELLYLYPLQRRKTERTATRKRIAVPTVGNAAGFVESLGFAFDHEFYVTGKQYTFKEKLVVSVYRVFKMGEGGKPLADPIDPMHLVEIIGRTSPARNAVVVGNEMAEFSEQLRPLVLLQLFLEDSFRL